MRGGGGGGGKGGVKKEGMHPPPHHHVGPATVDRGYSANLTVVTNMLAGCDKKSALQKKTYNEAKLSGLP
jgi:hypothetical protein